MAYTSGDSLSAIFAALSDPTRRSIYDDLINSELSVSEIAAHKPVSRPAVSQHLKTLERAGLVEATPKGSHRYYAATRSGLDELRRYLDTAWDESLAAYAAEITKRNRNR